MNFEKYNMQTLKGDESTRMGVLSDSQREAFKSSLQEILNASPFEIKVSGEGFVEAIRNRYPNERSHTVLVAIYMGTSGQLTRIYNGTVRQDDVLCRDGFIAEFQKIRADKMPWM